MFIRRCAWHPKYHGYSKFLGITWSGWGIEFSHGICADCAARTRAEWRLPNAEQPAAPTPVPRRPLRSLRPDFALAAAVVVLAVTTTFALTGVPGMGRRESRTATVREPDIDRTSASPSSSSATAPAPSASTRTAPPATGSVPPSSAAPRHGSAPSVSPGGTSPAPQVAGPVNEPGAAWSGGGRPNRSRVSRVRGRSLAAGAGVVPVSAPERCPCPTEQAPALAAATSLVSASAPELPSGPSRMGHFGANRFNEVQAP